MLLTSESIYKILVTWTNLCKEIVFHFKTPKESNIIFPVNFHNFPENWRIFIIFPGNFPIFREIYPKFENLNLDFM